MLDFWHGTTKDTTYLCHCFHHKELGTVVSKWSEMGAYFVWHHSRVGLS